MDIGRIDQLQQMLKEDPGDQFLRYAYALELRSAGRTQEALDHLRALIADAPEHVAAHHQLAITLGEVGSINEAVTAARNGLRTAEAHGDRKAAGELRGFIEAIEDGK